MSDLGFYSKRQSSHDPYSGETSRTRFESSPVVSRGLRVMSDWQGKGVFSPVDTIHQLPVRLSTAVNPWHWFKNEEYFGGRFAAYQQFQRQSETRQISDTYIKQWDLFEIDRFWKREDLLPIEAADLMAALKVIPESIRWNILGPGNPPEATLFGKVESIHDNFAIVTMVNSVTGDLIEAECTAETLIKAHVGEGDEFRCDVFREGEIVSARFERIAPKQISQQEIAQIIDEIGDLSL